MSATVAVMTVLTAYHIEIINIYRESGNMHCQGYCMHQTIFHGEITDKNEQNWNYAQIIFRWAFVCFDHRHLTNIDCLMARTTCLFCFISTVNGHYKKNRKEAKNLEQSIFSLDIYGLDRLS
jgi:hypothetical protein